MPEERTAARVARLAERYVPGSGPVRIDALGSGLVNRSYRVRRDGRAFSLRIAAPRASELGLDRGWECRVLRCAAGAGLAPAVERCEPRAGVLVMRWAEGGSWAPDQAGSRAALDALALLVRRVHELPLPGRARRVRPAQWIAFYRRSLERRGGRPPSKSQDRRRLELAQIAQSLLDGLGEEPSAQSALCHGDLHVQNLVITAAAVPLILDWEYAHVSDPWWDLAGWACNGDLTAERRHLLLQRYLGREPTPQGARRLGRLAWLYDYMCLLWSELYLSSRPDPSAARAAVSARARGLADRLGREP
jgi:aminoglycoside phosphotransferase (APT) family kinase protein